MLEAQLYTAGAEPKGTYALPNEFDGQVHETALYYAVRAYLANQRHGTHSTKTRSEVSGGGRKPWRQKGTGRARQGTIRAAQWTGGGIVFGPRPRSYRTDLPRKLKRLARQSALNARANEGAVFVIESLAFEQPKTKQMAELVGKLGLEGRKVLVLTAEARPPVYLSSRNLRDVHVIPYADASPYELLWSDAVVIEEGAIGGHEIKGAIAKPSRRTTGTRKAAKPGTKKKSAGRAMTKKRSTAKKASKTTKKTARTKAATSGKRKGGGNA
jgi:large subunit ribosomal protein L4